MTLGRAVLAAALLGSLALPATAAPPGPRTVYDLTALFDSYAPDKARVEKLRAAATAAPPATENPAELMRFYYRRAFAARTLGLVDQQIEDLEKALPLSRTPRVAKSAGGGAELRVLSALARAWSQRDYHKSMEYSQRVRDHPSSNPGWDIPESQRIANALISRKRFEEANREISRMQTLLMGMEAPCSGAQCPKRPYLAFLSDYRAYVDRARAYYLRERGKLDEAEPLYRSAVAHMDRALADVDEGVRASFDLAPGEGLRATRDATLRSLAITLEQAGRLDEAELLLRDQLRAILERVGRNSPEVGDVLRALASVVYDQGRSREALMLAQRAVRHFDEIGYPRATIPFVHARMRYAALLTAPGRYADSVKEYESLERDLVADGELQEALFEGNRTFGWALLYAGRIPEAVAKLRASATNHDRVLGPTHVESGISRGYLGMALAASGDDRAALRELRAALEILAGAESVGLELLRRNVRVARSIARIAAAYVELLHRMRDSGALREAGIDAAAEALTVSDLARGQSVQRAVAAAAARAATQSPELANLVRKEQDLAYEADALYRFLITQHAVPAERQLPKVVADMRARIEAITRERRTLAREVEKGFPAYANFVNPKPPRVAELRGALAEGEALVSILTTAERTFVWVIPKAGAIAFHSSPLGEKQLAPKVAALRRALDVGNAVLAQLPAFDFAIANELYAALLRPAGSTLAGVRSLIVVANGSLGQIPFSVLVEEPLTSRTNPSAGFGDYANAAWLARRFAVSHLPSTNALVVLRATKLESAQRPFVGFGDPVFGSVAAASPAAGGATLRNLRIARDSEDDLASGKPEKVRSYRALASLPDTRDELLAIAAAMKADPARDVFLGAAATKDAVKQTDLSHSRIVAFATHGLLPGDLPGLTQPALALAPSPGTDPDREPASAMLLLEDVLGLKLNAEWVVLSACNTAAGDGAGAEAVSGLGRGFFYAGTRALLVTHWPVETVSARKLVTALFERYAAQPALARAEALRQAMLELMQDGARGGDGKLIYSYAHPLFWAPYALIGDGAR